MSDEQMVGASASTRGHLWRNHNFLLLEGGQQVSALGTSIPMSIRGD